MLSSRAAVALVLAAGLQAETPHELRALVRKSLAGLDREDRVKAGYLFRTRTEQREYDAAGKQTSHTATVSVREIRDGAPVSRVVERDGKPLSATEAAAQEQQIRKEAAARRAGRESEPRKNARSEWLQEFPEALDYKPMGEETIHGRPALILDFEPRPGYRPANLKARVFEKMRGRLWIDKSEGELVRTEAEMFDTVSIGFGVFGRIAKGTSMSLARQKTGEGHWLMEFIHFRFNARFLFRNVRQEQSTRYYEYRRFPAEPLAAKAAAP